MSDHPPPKTPPPVAPPPIILPPVTLDSPAFTDINGRVWTWGRWFVLNYYQRILVTRGLNPYNALHLTGDEETSHRLSMFHKNCEPVYIHFSDNSRDETPGSTGTKCDYSDSSNGAVAAVPEDANQPCTSGISTQTIPRIAVPGSVGASIPDNQPSVAGTSAEPSASSTLPVTDELNEETVPGLQAGESAASIQNHANGADLLEATPNESEQMPLDTFKVANPMGNEMGATVAAVDTIGAAACSSAAVQETSRALLVVEPESSVSGHSNSPGPTIDEDPFEEEEVIPMEVVGTPSQENFVVPHVVLDCEITTDVPPVSVEVTIRTSEDFDEGSVERQSSNGNIRQSLNEMSEETEQRSKSSVPVVENRTSKFEGEEHNHSDDSLEMNIVEQAFEGEHPDSNTADDNIPMEVDEAAPVDPAVDALSQIHETTDTAQAHTPEEELMEVTNENRKEEEEETHEMSDDELTKEAEKIIKEVTDNRRPYEQHQRGWHLVPRIRQAEFDEPSTSSGEITEYVYVENQRESSANPGQFASAERSTRRPALNELYDNHQNRNAIRNLIEIKKTSARNEPSTNFEESQEVQRAIEESLKTASPESIRQLSARNDTITSLPHYDGSPNVQENGNGSSNEVGPCTSSAQQDCHQDVQIDNDSSTTKIDLLENTSQAANGHRVDPITSTTYSDNNQEVQETDQFERMETPDSDQDVPSSSSPNNDDNQMDQQNKIESSTHEVQVESTNANDPTSSRTDFNDDQEVQTTDDEYLSDQFDNTSEVVHFEDYQEIQENEDEISNHADQSENARHATEGPEHDQPTSSSANYYDSQEEEGSNHADQFEDTGNGTMNVARNESCTSSAYYGSYQEVQSDDNESLTHADQLANRTQFANVSYQNEQSATSADYEEYEEESLRDTDQFGSMQRMEPVSSSSAPYEVLQEVRENIEGSSYQFGSLERPRRNPAYDEPSTSSAYYYGHREVQRNFVDSSREDHHFEDSRRSLRRPAQDVPSTSSAYYNNYQEVQSNDVGNSELAEELERLERPRRRPAHNHSTRSPAQNNWNREVQRNVVDSSREVDSFDDRRRSTRRRTPNVRSISPDYHNNYQEDQRNSIGSSSLVDQRSRNRPAQNEPSTSSAWSENYGLFDQEVSRSVPRRSRAVQLNEDMVRTFERSLSDQPSTSPEISGIHDPNESVRDYLIRMNSLRSNALYIRPDVLNGQLVTRQREAMNSTRSVVQERQQHYSQETNQRQPPSLHNNYDSRVSNQPVRPEAVDVREESPKPTKKYERFVVQKRKEHHLTRAKTAKLGLSPEEPMKKKPTPSRKRERSDSETSDWSPDNKKKKPGKKNNKKGKK